ncbi:MAG: malonyl-ACP O-methyltransferase BioC [Porticoccaceae bacterium]|jgi:malonyl-CoA O-methyltransferase|nr:malonyl-ACP O-methyltransferase BioC [Porticoccaceae bacterium]
MDAGDALSPPPLALHPWPATGADPQPCPLVLLHGWGGDSGAWDELVPLLRERFAVIAVDLPGFGASAPAPWTLDGLLAQLALALPPRCLLVGWSLGGMLATAYAHRYPGRVAGLVTLAANASFIQREGWPAAMPPALFGEFAAGFAADPAATLVQFTAFQARGDDRERAVARALRARLPGSAPAHWGEALGLLGDLDNRAALAALAVPALCLFGERDLLVPAAAVGAIAGLNPAIATRVLAGTAHAPQFSDPARLAALVADFASGGDDGYRIDKAEVARSFSRAAATYDQVAHLQRAVGGELLAAVPDNLPPGPLADLGCGTGYFTERLAAFSPARAVLGIDLAEGMCAHARCHRAAAIHWVCGDAEALPCGDESLALVYSNFAVQWCQDLPRLMAELFRALRPGGALVFSTVGPESLRELRDAWRAVDRYVHVNRFAPLERVRDALRGAGFALGEFRSEQRVNHYAQLRDLTQELKGLGAHNVNRGRNAGLTGRRHIEALKAAYENHRTPEGLPASWEILTAVARRP